VGQGNEDPGTDPSGGTPPGTKPETKTFTQEDLSRVAAKEKDEGRRAAEKIWLDKLGVASVDEAETLIKAKKEADDAKLSELEKREKAATEAALKADKALGDATKTVLENRVERAVLAKILGESAQAAVTAAATIRKLVEVGAEADDKAITAAVEDLAKSMPQLFALPGNTNQAEPGKGRPVPPPPPPAPGRPGKAPDPASDARTLLHKRHPHLAKSGDQPGRRT